DWSIPQHGCTRSTPTARSTPAGPPTASPARAPRNPAAASSSRAVPALTLPEGPKYAAEIVLGRGRLEWYTLALDGEMMAIDNTSSVATNTVRSPATVTASISGATVSKTWRMALTYATQLTLHKQFRGFLII